MSESFKITSENEIHHIVSTKWIENWENYVNINQNLDLSKIQDDVQNKEPGPINNA